MDTQESERASHDLSTSSLRAGEEYSDTIFSGIATADAPLHALRIWESEFRKVRLDALKLPKLHLTSVTFIDSSLAGTDVSDCSLDRVSCNKSRLTGTVFSTGRIEDCQFQDCAANFSLYRFSKLKNVQFVDCNLKGADFQEATLRHVTFTRCNLEDVDFNHAKLDHVDFRTSDITTIRGIQNLGGAIISPSQLMSLSYALASEAGIRVED